MMYMSSSCANDGSYSLTVTFHQNVDLNMAQVLVQNRVSLAIPKLPDVIKQTGVTTLKRSPDILMGISLNSPHGRYPQLYLSNYALRLVKNQDVTCRLDGKETVFLAIFQLPDANALDTADRIKAKMNDLARTFPEDLSWEIGFTTVPYTEESLKEVVKTLRDAIVLVALV